MSWRDNKNRGGGYSRGGGRGYRHNRGGGNSRQGSSENQGEEGGHRQHSGFRGWGGGYRGRPYKRTQTNQSYDGKRPKYEVGKRLKEDDIGVTEFVGTHKRFGGIIKERFGDFHVHEISCDGEICKLTNQDIPPEPQELEDIEKLKESISSDVQDKLEAFTKPDGDVSTMEIDVTEMDKDVRRNIHIIAKKVPNIISETIERGDKKIIVLAKKTKQSGHKFRGDQRVDWSAREGNYCHFLLHKVNMDTMDALNQLAIKLRIKSDIFHYSGTKDRRARTTQWVSLKKISPTNIHDAARQVRGAYVGNFKFAKDPLKLGMLNGNRFRIALRSVDGTDEEIEKAVKSLRDHGFINYYGLQRFGTIAAIPTHEIGKALLQGKWEDAIELILKPRLGEQHRDMIQAREIYQNTKDAAAALKPIARSGKIEAKLLRGIANSGETNPQGALDHIPRNARLMYIHAYQSFVWNHIVSRRIKEFGSKPIIGDLVYEKSDSKDIIESEMMDYGLQNDEENEAKVEKNEVQVEKNKDSTELMEKGVKAADADEDVEKSNNEKTKIPVEEIQEMDVTKDEKEKQIVSKEEKNEQTVSKDEEDKQVVSKDEKGRNDGKEEQTENAKLEVETETLDDSKDQSSLPAVRALTEDDLPNYTLGDVVLPKPGWKVTYPSYAKPWFDEFLAKDDLTTDLRQKNKKYSLGGAYRKILETPGDLSWRIARYNGYHDDLILCDVDEMRGMEPPKEELEGKYKALILEFSLKPSTYATMALREILEHDTSAHTQAAQSAANQAQDNLERGKKMETNGDAMAEITEETAKEQNAIMEKSEDAQNGETAKKADYEKTEPEIVDITDATQFQEKIVKEANGSEMEVVEDGANIPAVDEGQKMETESTEPSDITEKIEDNA